MFPLSGNSKETVNICELTPECREKNNPTDKNRNSTSTNTILEASTSSNLSGIPAGFSETFSIQTSKVAFKPVCNVSCNRAANTVAIPSSLPKIISCEAGNNKNNINLKSEYEQQCNLSPLSPVLPQNGIQQAASLEKDQFIILSGPVYVPVSSIPCLAKGTSATSGTQSNDKIQPTNHVDSGKMAAMSSTQHKERLCNMHDYDLTPEKEKTFSVGYAQPMARQDMLFDENSTGSARRESALLLSDNYNMPVAKDLTRMIAEFYSSVATQTSSSDLVSPYSHYDNVMDEVPIKQVSFSVNSLQDGEDMRNNILQFAARELPQRISSVSTENEEKKGDRNKEMNDEKEEEEKEEKKEDTNDKQEQESVDTKRGTAEGVEGEFKNGIKEVILCNNAIEEEEVIMKEEIMHRKMEKEEYEIKEVEGDPLKDDDDDDDLDKEDANKMRNAPSVDFGETAVNQEPKHKKADSLSSFLKELDEAPTVALSASMEDQIRQVNTNLDQYRHVEDAVPPKKNMSLRQLAESMEEEKEANELAEQLVASSTPNLTQANDSHETVVQCCGLKKVKRPKKESLAVQPAVIVNSFHSDQRSVDHLTPDRRSIRFSKVNDTLINEIRARQSVGSNSSDRDDAFMYNKIIQSPVPVDATLRKISSPEVASENISSEHRELSQRKRDSTG